ncbi:MAG: serine--tRNA ligase [Methylacidiphilales bacterium]|nr:serine--tRNA ligase [Candidatus Methylacidiphilales bacterium]MDW8349988.1 serine--tRNA ligase [Verrucomicrobiae bacterium]
MLDIRHIREQAENVKEALRSRGRGDENAIDQLLAIDEERRKLITQVEHLKSERNRVSKLIGAKKSRGEEVSELLDSMKKTSDEITAMDARLAQIEEQQQQILLTIPNLPHPSVPRGQDASHNRVERVWGTPPSFDFIPKPHWEIAEKLGWLDFSAAAKISGSGFVVYKGQGARLERALINYILDIHTQKHGYLEVNVPHIVRGTSMVGTGQLPKFAEDMYRLENEESYLIPTAEVPVTNLHREEILSADSLPIAYAAFTPCFRREAGSAGKDTRGMIRMHQFDKVELVHITTPERSYATLERLVEHVEVVLQNLGLHYRVVSLCTGDMGFGAAKCYDIEVWAPGLGAWLEVSSCSNFEDFQARRMQLRYRPAEGEKPRFCHTLNGSGPALARLYIALLETYQQRDGSVLLPEAIRAYI